MVLSRKYNTTKLGTHFPSPSSHQQNISINHHLFPSPYPSPPPFSTLQLQSKPVPGSERSVIEFLVSSCRVLLWALPVSNKFQSVNSPLTLARPSIHLPYGYLYGVTPPNPIRTCADRPRSAPPRPNLLHPLSIGSTDPVCSLPRRQHAHKNKQELRPRIFSDSITQRQQLSDLRLYDQLPTSLRFRFLTNCLVFGCYTISCDYILPSKSPSNATLLPCIAAARFS